MRPGGRIAFYTIFTPVTLSDAEYRRAAPAGARAVGTRREHAEMLRSAGFVEIAETDVTAQFQRTNRDWFEARERYAAALRRSLGEQAFAAKQAENRAQAEAIEQGLLRRSLFVARRPR